MTNNIHNLSKVKAIPIKFQCLLNLGLKYCVSGNISKKEIHSSLHSACRKIAWQLYFKINDKESELSGLQKWYVSFRKEYRKINKIETLKCPMEDELFNYQSLLNKLCKKMMFYTSRNKIDPLIMELKQFCIVNDISIIEADKNAGICIVNNIEYRDEVLRQLYDCNTYHPSTETHFNLAMGEFKDKLRSFEKCLPLKSKMSTIVNETNRPAQFYILPKIHKPFDKFPKGRPISSTFNKTNKIACSLLDRVLKPCTNDIKDLLIDTQHLLLLLDNIKLNPNKKYSLVTIDVEALYPSLNLNDCKKHCLDMYELSKTMNEVKLTRNQLSNLLDLSLDYNYVQYENEWFYQHRGVEMGNIASVMVANITVFRELSHLFSREELIFYKRFLDDILLILDCTDILDVNEYISSLVKHRYLKFTFEIGYNCVNFLDTTISIKDNRISVSLFKKPMSRHVYLHASSNHPSHLKNSLYYSQGLRVVRTCSEMSERLKNLLLMFKQFSTRWYDDKLLYSIFEKLMYISRGQALCPKKNLLIEYIRHNEPNLYTKYNLSVQTNVLSQSQSKHTYLVFPFYKQVPKYNQLVKSCIMQHLLPNNNRDIQRHVEDLHLRVVFTRVRNVKERIKPRKNTM